MSEGSLILDGVVHGRTIEPEREPGIAEGQTVSVTISVPSALPSGRLKAFGSCASEAESLDAVVQETYCRREAERKRESDVLSRTER